MYLICLGFFINFRKRTRVSKCIFRVDHANDQDQTKVGHAQDIYREGKVVGAYKNLSRRGKGLWNYCELDLDFFCFWRYFVSSVDLKKKNCYCVTRSNNEPNVLVSLV